MTDFRDDRVGSALAGTNPTVLVRLPSGFAAIGDIQDLPGYCVLLTDRLDVDQLTDLDPAEQELFLADAALLARAVGTVCAARDPEFRRINLEIQGNLDAFLHAHVTPRYEWEPEQVRPGPHALWSWAGLRRDENQLGPQHEELRAELVAEIERQLALRSTERSSVN